MLKWVVQFPGHVRLLQPHGMQCIRPPCPSPSPRVCPSSCSLHLWCHPAISSSNFLFSSALNFPQHQGLFQCVIFLHQITKTLKFQLQHKSFQWVVRVDLPQDWLVWSPSCPRDFQESSPMPQFEGISALVFCLLYAPAPTTIYDHWENCRLDYMDLCRQSNVSAFQHIV